MNTKIIVRRVGVLSLAKVMGGVYALLGLIVGAFVTLLVVAGAALSLAEGSSGGLSKILGAGAIVAFPILYGVIGFVGGLITGALYNLFAGMFGGVEIETVQAQV